ncbi:hypothetical protein D9758_014983 [Tetrapyrgos nigripes]|uniref:Uncharacterized protein n=1 Tax=Tetrapyrgos nigripes TaxID=182062 RepID=A0A8H5FKQ0_9AGAR|nr:hypothetical protein D9758_014983 [Tetrapyrgos nigripes]
MQLRLGALFISLFGLLLAGVLGTPTSDSKQAADADQIAGIGIGDIINLLGIGLVKSINATITLDSLVTNLISYHRLHWRVSLSTFFFSRLRLTSVSLLPQQLESVSNPLPIELTLTSVKSSAGINNTEYASFDHTFSPPLVVPILGQASSGKIDNVLLTQGAVASLDIIPLGVLDLLDTDVNVRAGSIFGIGGIPLPIDDLKQSNVPVTYTLDLGTE